MWRLLTCLKHGGFVVNQSFDGPSKRRRLASISVSLTRPLSHTRMTPTGTRDGYPSPPARKSTDTARCTPWLSRNYHLVGMAGVRGIAVASTTNRGHGYIS